MSPNLLRVEGTQLSVRRVLEGPREWPNVLNLVIDLEFIGLDEYMSRLGESKAISHPLKMNSTSCSYNSVSQGQNVLIGWG